MVPVTQLLVDLQLEKVLSLSAGAGQPRPLPWETQLVDLGPAPLVLTPSLLLFVAQV